MKTKLRKLWLLLAGLLLLVTACGNQDNTGEQNAESNATDTQDDGEIVTLTMYQIGDPPKEQERLSNYLNDILEEKYHAHLDIEYIGYGDYNQKVNVIVNGGDEYDIAKAENFVENAQRGAYADLTDLIKEYAPESLAYLDDAYIKGNTVNGKLYAFPVNGNISAQQMFAFKPEIVEKYDLDVSNVKGWKDLEPILAKVKEAEPNRNLIAANSGFNLTRDFDRVIKEIPLGIDFNGDETKIVNQFDTDTLLGDIETIRDFYQKGYIAPDAATSNKAYNYNDPDWVVRLETVGPRDFGNYLLSKAFGENTEVQIAPYGQYPIKSNDQARIASFVIAQNSEHKELALQVLNEINSNPELLNTLVNGFEGEYWEKNDDGTIKILKQAEPGAFEPAWKTGNAEILYPDEAVTDEQKTAAEHALNDAKESPLLGFDFDSSAVRSEITNVNNVYTQYVPGLFTGSVDPETTLPEFREELKKAGIDKIQAEMQKQFDEFQQNK